MPLDEMSLPPTDPGIVACYKSGERAMLGHRVFGCGWHRYDGRTTYARYPAKGVEGIVTEVSLDESGRAILQLAFIRPMAPEDLKSYCFIAPGGLVLHVDCETGYADEFEKVSD